jgi:PAS domain S-box-containing protein
MERIVLNGDDVPEIEYRFKTKDGRWIWCLSRDSVFARDEDGSVSQFVGTFFDMTSQKVAEEALVSERDRLSALVASMQDEVWFADAQKRFTFANPAAIEQFGLMADEAVDVENLAASLEVLRPDGSPRPIEEAPPLRALKGEVVTNEEEIIRLPATGELRHRQVNAAPVRNKNGQIIGSVSVARGITESKRSEEKLKESEERFRTMANGLPLIVWVHDAKGNQQFVNQTFLEFFGTTHDQIKDGRWQLLLHPDDSQEYADEFLACTREQRFFHRQARVRNAEGAWRWMESWGRPHFTTSGEYLGHVGASADITDRKQAEEQLYMMTKNLEKQVTERTALAESRTKQLQALAIELIETEERERRQFAHLLHDDLQQMLAYAKMRLQAKAEDLASNSTLISVAGLLEECIAKSRRLSHEISPAILYQAGLMECYKWLAENMRKQFGLNVELVLHSELSLEVMPLKIFLFRALQELLFNIVKHSGVESARVEVVNTEESITVTVSDEGCGFDSEIINSHWDKLGFGLLTIKERADYIGGVFEVGGGLSPRGIGTAT